MINKKGISDVVTTVLIILLVVAAVAIIWSFVQRPIQQGGQALQASSDCLQLSVVPITCTRTNSITTTTYANVTYKFASGTVTPTGINVIYQLADGTSNVSASAIPSGVGSTQKSGFTTVTTNNVTSVTVSAVVRGADGKDVVCAESEKITCV